MPLISNNHFKKVSSKQKFVPALAFGADLKSSFAVAKGKEILLSPTLGDLADYKVNRLFKDKINSSVKSLRIKPKIAACDLHPDYFSTRLAEDFSEENKIPLKRIQHHHAHIAACLLENNFAQPALGVSFDGTGYGTDGAIWGGEFLLVDKRGFKRLAHLEYVDLPGGDLAAQEPWRMGLIYLYSCFGEKFWDLKIDFVKKLDRTKAKLVLKMISKNINNYKTSSMGRLFDAVASICSICQINRFEAQAPQLLEKRADKNVSEKYRFSILKQNCGLIISAKPVIRNVVKDLLAKEKEGEICAKFHNAVAWMTFEVLSRLAKSTKIKTVALSGGVFQNKILFANTVSLLQDAGFRVLIHKTTPSDASIPLGQIQVLNWSK